MGVGALLGGGLALGGALFGGGGGTGGYYSGSSPPPTYIPQNQPGADSMYWNILQSQAPAGENLQQQLLPQYGNLLNWIQTTSGPGTQYGSQVMQGAGAAQSLYGLAAGEGGNASTLSAAAGGSIPYASNQLADAMNYVNTAQQYAGGALPYAQNILQTGFDPQQALYNRSQQQTLDQANAINAMYGLNASPAGAGLANQALSNFNIDWQNQQLGRQAQALQGYNQALSGYGNSIGGALTGLNQAVSGYGTALDTMGRGFSGALNLANAGAQSALAGGAAPYTALTGLQNNQLGALNNYAQGVSGSFGLDQNTLSQIAAYLKLGQSGAQIGQSGAQQQFGNLQSMGSAIGGMIPPSWSLNNLFGPGGGGGSGYNLGYGTGYSDPYASELGVGAVPY